MPVLGGSPSPLICLRQCPVAALRGTITLPRGERRASTTGMALRAAQCREDLLSPYMAYGGCIYGLATP
jgi:hypothetical protein